MSYAGRVTWAPPNRVVRPSGKSGKFDLAAGTGCVPIFAPGKKSEPLTPRFKSGDQLHGFTLRQRIGRGAFGEVYLSQETETGKYFAIKLAYGEDHSKTLATEGAVIKRFSNRHIVGFVNEGQLEGNFGLMRYLAMEYIEGTTLSSSLARNRLSLPRALELAGQICYGLKAAAEKGVIHRDLKPSNVMIRKDGSAVLIDFGLSEYESDDGLTVGTPQYMSPEQHSGLELDSRCDIYSLGLMLYEMIEGRLPYKSDTDNLDGNKLSALIKEKQMLQMPVMPNVPSAVRELIVKMTALDREARPQNYDQLLAELEAIKTQIAEVSGGLAALQSEIDRAQPENPDAPDTEVDLKPLTRMEVNPPTFSASEFKQIQPTMVERPVQ